MGLWFLQLGLWFCKMWFAWTKPRLKNTGHIMNQIHSAEEGWKSKVERSNGDRLKLEKWAQWNWQQEFHYYWPSEISRATAQTAASANSSYRTCTKCEQPQTSIPMSFLSFRSQQQHAKLHETQASANTHVVGPWCLWCQQRLTSSLKIGQPHANIVDNWHFNFTE